ncbi:MAG: phytoene desaturase [Bacteroidales bacterium]|nr:phytoene desaturase [Bacteroidales bacterium]
MPQSVCIIGSGFSGLSAACYLAKNGFKVSIFEKNNFAGGRAGQIKENGFIFDLGPSWYWMPDVFENFFNDFGKKVSDFYHLTRLDPSYRVFFSSHEYINIPAELNQLYLLFESIEKGSSLNLKKLLNDAEYKYKIGIHKYALKPGKSVFEYIDFDIFSGLLKLDVFKSVTKYLQKAFKDERLIRILEFPVIFLGSTPQRIPALYTLMNYADLVLGSWYPLNGMYKVVEGMLTLAKSLGVKILLSSKVESISIIKNLFSSIYVNGIEYFFDYLVASADYHHIEADLLDSKNRNYTEKYWETRELAPSAVIMYLGVNKKLDNLLHHNIFFDVDFYKHADEIYNYPNWPENPCLYVSCTSKTDKTVAPANHENMVILIPVAPGLTDNEGIKNKYFNLAVSRIEKITGQTFKENIIYKRIFAHSDFINIFNAYKGNAYGLSNVLEQTGFLKPKIRNKKIKNLYYTGQMTVPGPGVPPALLSGKIIANEIINNGGNL